MIFNMNGGIAGGKEASGTVTTSTSVVTVALDFEPIAVFVEAAGATTNDAACGAFLVFEGVVYRAFNTGATSRPSTDFAPNGKGFDIKNVYGNNTTYKWRAIGI